MPHKVKDLSYIYVYVSIYKRFVDLMVTMFIIHVAMERSHF